MIHLDKNGLLNRLTTYPLSARCFSNYVRWVTSNVSGGWESYDVIRVLDEGDDERLDFIEACLDESRNILGISEKEFAHVFGFNDDLLTDDPEKIHDILAEPLLVVDLARWGFSSIKKLPAFIRTANGKVRNADFVASYNELKFAIELKTVRMENKPKPVPGRLLGNSAKSDWWGDMFRRNAITKIEDKGRRVLEQLTNARNHYKCDKTLFVLYTRRLGPSTLMAPEDYVVELHALLRCYPEVDHIGCKDYFGQVTLVPKP